MGKRRVFALLTFLPFRLFAMSTMMTFIAFKHGNKSYEYGHLSLRRRVIFMLVIITTLSLIKCTSVSFLYNQDIFFLLVDIPTWIHSGLRSSPQTPFMRTSAKFFSPFLVIKRKMQISWSSHLHFQTEWERYYSS